MCLKLASELLDFLICQFKKNQPKPIIRTGVTVPNVQKCVMVATLTLHIGLRSNFSSMVFFLSFLFHFAFCLSVPLFLWKFGRIFLVLLFFGYKFQLLSLYFYTLLPGFNCFLQFWQVFVHKCLRFFFDVALVVCNFVSYLSKFIYFNFAF